MPSLTVINTSPLIFLSKGGYLELLQVLVLETLRLTGMYLSDAVMNRALVKVGE